jgi:hypothetical protein
MEQFPFAMGEDVADALCLDKLVNETYDRFW